MTAPKLKASPAEVGIYDVMGLIQLVRWGKVDLGAYNLNRRNRLRLTALLRRLDWLEEKDREYARANGYGEAEMDALRWAIAFILYSVGDSEEVEQ